MTLLTLSPKERGALENLAAHTNNAAQLRRAQALLWLDEGETVQEVAERLRVSRQAVYKWVTQFQGRSALDLAARVSPGERSGRPRAVHGGIEPLMVEVIDQDPRELGYRATVWTAPLVSHYLWEVPPLDVSRQSVSLAIARLGLRWKRPRHHLAAGQRGLKRGLAARERTVILMLDETIITETPPLYSCYGWLGKQVGVPITGNHARRIRHGAINVWSGEGLLLITEEWGQETHQAFLAMIRSRWRGWHIVVFEDRGAPHTAEGSLGVAKGLNLKLRFLPKATPELNAMDQLWRHVKGRALANRATRSIDESADSACRYLLDMGPRERLRKAGVLSGNFWLTK